MSENEGYVRRWERFRRGEVDDPAIVAALEEPTPERYVDGETGLRLAVGGEKYLADGSGRIRCQGRAKSKMWDGLSWPENQCGQPARPGFSVCEFHGAGKRGGPPGGRPPDELSRHHVLKKLGYGADYERGLGDPDIISLHSEMAMFDARVNELFRRMEGVPSGPEALEEFESGLDLIEHDKIDEGVAQIRRTLNSIRAEGELWSEIRAIEGERRRMADTERKFEAEKAGYWSPAEMKTFLNFVLNTLQLVVGKVIQDAELQRQLIFALTAELGGAVARVSAAPPVLESTVISQRPSELAGE